MIKLTAIDLDGTLFNSSQQISPANQQALEKASARGIKIVIVTGRGRRGAEMALDMLGMELPYICAAGALARPGREGVNLYAHVFHRPKELSHVIDFARQTEAGLIAETLDGSPIWFGPDSLGQIMDPMTARDAWKSIRSLEPEKDFDRPLLKITLVGEPELLQQAEKIIHQQCPSLHQTYAGPIYLDLTSQGVNKGSALKALAELWNIHPHAIAAIGDQAIDLAMLKFAGLPIAMSNAVPQLKEVAKWIAPSHDEDGVAWALEKIMSK